MLAASDRSPSVVNLGGGLRRAGALIGVAIEDQG